MTEPLDLDPIRTRLEAASPGPWRWEDWGDPPVDHERSAHTLASDELSLTKAICTAAQATSMWKNPADADLIAHAQRHRRPHRRGGAAPGHRPRDGDDVVKSLFGPGRPSSLGTTNATSSAPPGRRSRQRAAGRLQGGQRAGRHLGPETRQSVPVAAPGEGDGKRLQARVVPDENDGRRRSGQLAGRVSKSLSSAP
jgi:hypothetical protein